MDRLASRTFLCCLLFLVFTGTKGQQPECENGWFGDKCQYQCHCLDNAVCDKTTGDCPGDCDVRWFGPQCQYWDAAYYQIIWLTDGNDRTCLGGPSLTQDFPMLDDVMFSWMRIVTNKPVKTVLFDRVNMTFLSNDETEVVPKSPLTKIFVSDTILELYGELQHRIRSIRLTFDTKATRVSFCSMQVSAGRNVAIKQNASQSSTYQVGAEKAVDGQSSMLFWDQGSCISTNTEDSSYWTLNLSLPVTVNMYTLLSLNDSWDLCRLRYFRLESYFGSAKVQQYDATTTEDSFTYDVYSLDTSLITSITLTVSKFRWPNDTYVCNNGNTSLAFCEMEIYGDVVCPDGKWGRDCEKDCNCQDPCFVSTGMCPSGCKAGFQGPGCQEECGSTFYGVNCAKRCNDMCVDKLCSRINGVCDKCPDGKTVSMDCSEDCSPGFYGPNCSKPCSEHCGGDGFCNNINGSCLSGCKPGYTSDKCDQQCNATYYGENCATPCSENCINQECHRITGVCENCPDGKQISMDCSKNCSPGYFGPNCTEQCSEHCGEDGLCSNVNGSCLHGCKPGYSAENCVQPCPHTTYGQDCSKTCSMKCVANVTQEPAVCGHETGQCLLGCVSGYSGITCEEIPGDQDEINPVIIVVPILLVIILVAAVIFGILFWRRRKSHKNGSEDTTHSPVVMGKHNGIENDNKAKRSSDHPSTSNPYEMASDIHTYEEISGDQVDVYINTPETQVKFSKTAIPVESLGEYLASHNLEFLTAQFQKLPECNATTKAAEISENKPKNRYKNILAYDHSRVRLHVSSKKKQDDYYNANFIQGFDGAKYIASQGPNKAVLADFIRMIWEQDVELVVMLTKVVELGKAKCESYWPTQDASEVTFGEITVELAATQVLADYTKRTLQLTKNDGEFRFVTQYHFTSWPDKGVPTTPWALVDFEQVVDYHYDTEKPLLVHCSAGVGRTGTFIALRNALKEAKATGYVDFYQTVTKMRQYRVFMIQTAEQYCFLHDAVQVALLCQDALTTTAALDERMKVLMEVTETGQTNIEKEFKMVCDLVKKEIGNETENEVTEYVNAKETDQNFMTNIKDRFTNVPAKKEHRPKLSSDPKNDYINAVLVPSMTKQDQQVLTQLPLPNTVEDFWRLVTQYNISLIVAFYSDEQNQENPVGSYLPKNNKPLECGNFEISGDTVTHGAFWEKEKIHVQVKSGVKNPSYLHHIKCTKPKLDTKDWLQLTKELHSMAPLRDARTLYMCLNGADQSGFACVLSLLINRVEHDHFLTVPLVVGEIKSIRPEVIPNKDQYCSLYKILQLHCDMLHVYTNHTPHSLRNMQNGKTHTSKPGHDYSKTIASDETEKLGPHQKIPAENKASANERPPVGKSESKDKTEASEPRPVSSPEQALSKQNLKPHDGQGYSELL